VSDLLKRRGGLDVELNSGGGAWNPVMQMLGTLNRQGTLGASKDPAFAQLAFHTQLLGEKIVRHFKPDESKLRTQAMNAYNQAVHTAEAPKAPVQGASINAAPKAAPQEPVAAPAAKKLEGTIHEFSGHRGEVRAYPDGSFSVHLANAGDQGSVGEAIKVIQRKLAWDGKVPFLTAYKLTHHDDNTVSIRPAGQPTAARGATLQEQETARRNMTDDQREGALKRLLGDLLKVQDLEGHMGQVQRRVSVPNDLQLRMDGKPPPGHALDVGNMFDRLAKAKMVTFRENGQQRQVRFDAVKQEWLDLRA
jgi:hypothetical protein